MNRLIEGSIGLSKKCARIFWERKAWTTSVRTNSWSMTRWIDNASTMMAPQRKKMPAISKVTTKKQHNFTSSKIQQVGLCPQKPKLRRKCWRQKPLFRWNPCSTALFTTRKTVGSMPMLRGRKLPGSHRSSILHPTNWRDSIDSRAATQKLVHKPLS